MKKLKIKEIIRFDLNEKTYFTLEIPVALQYIGMGLYADVYVHHAFSPTNIMRYLLFGEPDALWEFVGSGERYIQKIMLGERELPADRLGRLGYESESYIYLMRQEKAYLMEPWNGWDYMPWGSQHNAPTACLYTSQGQIYFELAPRYMIKKYHIPRKVFMRNYRLYFQHTITSENALHFSQQLKVVADLMFKNQDDPDFVPAEYEYE